MYIKEDIILPQTVSFYDLIVNRAQGKSGPLFQFDVAEHAAMTFDPRMKSKDTHAGKNRKERKEGRKEDMWRKALVARLRHLAAQEEEEAPLLAFRAALHPALDGPCLAPTAG